jgi:hypothetical protein
MKADILMLDQDLMTRMGIIAAARFAALAAIKFFG